MNKTKISIIRDDEVIFTLYIDPEQAKDFCRYFNNNISNIDIATIIIED